MKYEGMREIAFTGDLIFHAGSSLGAKFLRVATASQYSHVGILLWKDGGLWICEMKPDTGYTMSPASDRILEMTKTGTVRFGRAPDKLVRKAVERGLSKYRDGDPDRKKDPAYSLPAAVIVWLAQWAYPLVPARWGWAISLLNAYGRTQYVCSTFVQAIWNEGGVVLDKLADPEDLARETEVLTRIDACTG